MGSQLDSTGMANRGTKRTLEHQKQKICSIFKKIGLSITIETNLVQVDFLDATYNLQRNEVKPFMKPNNEIVYVHKSRNHPYNITKNIPINISKRLSTL